MKCYLRLFVTGASIIAFCYTSFAQITVKQGVKKSLLQSGIKFYESFNDSGKIFDLGKMGGKYNTYDFTQFHYQAKPDVVKYIDPARTPYSNKFTSATHCQRVKRQSGLYDYVYFRLAKDGFYLLGAGFQKDEPLFVENPPRPLLKFPLSFTSAWEYKSLPREYGMGGTQQLQLKMRVVAAGTLKTPAGTQQCLVLQRDQLKILKTEKSTDTTKSMWYEFIAKDGTTASIVIDISQAGKRSPVIESASYSVKAGARDSK